MNILSEIPASIAKHIPIKAAILQAGIAASAKSLCADLGNVLVVADENTKSFVNIDGEKIILPGNQKADLEIARDLSKYHPDYFIAVGSGSLNDIVKYAAHLAGKPYIVFATAPSMNGYASTSASLLQNGFKKSFLASPPEKIYLDLEILSVAPKRLINSGIGDSICRATAQADVLLSAQAKNTPDYVELFTLTQKYENDIFDNIEALAKTLIFGGIAMLLAKSSAPASQGEHMLAHYMELMQPNAAQSFHGEQIAVTTLTMAQLQEELLGEKELIEIGKIDEKKIISHFGNEFGQYCLAQTHMKYDELRPFKINKPSIEKVLINAQILRKKLQTIGAPVNPSDIGWDEKIYKDAINYAKYTRDRFTFLDLIGI